MASYFILPDVGTNTGAYIFPALQNFSLGLPQQALTGLATNKPDSVVCGSLVG